MTVVHVRRMVLTDIHPFGGAKVEDAPEPQHEMTVAYAAITLGVARQTIRNTLSTHKHLFDVLEEPYTAGGERIITPRDWQILRTMYPRRKFPKGRQA